MRLSKRQLRRIIREEYSRLRRRGLIRENIMDQESILDIVEDIPFSSSTYDQLARMDKPVELLGIFEQHGQDFFEDGEMSDLYNEVLQYIEERAERFIDENTGMPLMMDQVTDELEMEWLTDLMEEVPKAEWERLSLEYR